MVPNRGGMNGQWLPDRTIRRSIHVLRYHSALGIRHSEISAVFTPPANAFSRFAANCLSVAMTNPPEGIQPPMDADGRRSEQGSPQALETFSKFSVIIRHSEIGIRKSETASHKYRGVV